MSEMILNLTYVPSKPRVLVWGSRIKWLGNLNGYSHIDLWYVALRFADAMDKRASTWHHSMNLFDNAAFMTNMYKFTEGMSIIMANKKTTPKISSDKPAWKGFIDYRLNDAHLEQFDNTQFDHTAVFEALAGLLMQGYRITHSYNGNNKTFTTTLIDNRSDSVLAGWALSAQGVDYFEALSMIVYKHFVALEQDWTSVHSPEKPVRRG